PVVRAELGDRPTPAAAPAKRKARPAPPRRVAESAIAERTERVAVRPASRSSARKSSPRVKARPVVRKVTRKAPAARRGMSAVVSFAWSKVGARYGTGAGRYDCSKFVQASYAAAGIS